LEFSVAEVVSPANDDFDNATVITALPFTDELDTTDATTAPDDPTSECLGGDQPRASVWYAFTPAQDLEIEATISCGFIAVYTGTRGQLSEITCEDRCSDVDPTSVFFHASAGQTVFFVTEAFAVAFGGISVTGSPSPPLEVPIDIKPGSVSNIINPTSDQTIPVAILSTDTFDALTVDTATVRFGGSGTGAAPREVVRKDVDGDVNRDLVLHFIGRKTGIACGDFTAVLTGATIAGSPIRGVDAIKTVGCQ
jgi:hypothetical protein